MAACGSRDSSTGTIPAATTPASKPCGTASAAPRYAHVVWVVMENHAYSQIIGSSEAPYTNELAAQCGLATNYKAIAHPSLPNYIAMTSGDTQGVDNDFGPSAHPLPAASIFSQSGTGRWRALQESMPENCDLGNWGKYAVRHNPAAYYTGIRADCAHQDVPLGSTPDLSARFTFVTPNLCNDTHDCSVSTGDAWLRAFFAKVFETSEYNSGRTAVFLTWDEDDDSSANHIATLVVAPSVRPGTHSATAFTHYSLLRTAEELLDLKPLLGHAASAPSMRSAFNLELH
jgi:phosphatidylinositol-3-phosphatase